MTAPYGVMADLHCHAWSQFSGVNVDGVNTRLAQILHEIERCCDKVLELHGSKVIIAGDLFHVRGKVTPSVFNPVRDCFERQRKRGILFRLIPGNHDLESEDSRKITSAVAMLGPETTAWIVDHEPCITHLGGLAFVPWIKKQADLLAAIEKLANAGQKSATAKVDLFIHAGIDGVLSGMPAHGLTAEKLASFGFRRVFAGHYHNHADMGHGVYSIGATTMQTWSDVGTKAGFLIVTDSEVRYHASHAPSFVDIDGTLDEDDLFAQVDGHYVRAKIGKATAAEVAHWREELVKLGAKGVLIQSSPASTPVRVGCLTGKLSGLPDTITAFCADKKLSAQVASLAHDILGEVTL